MRRPNLILFDLDGTLLDDGGLPEAIRRTCGTLAATRPGVTADDLVAANAAVWQELWPEVGEEYLLDPDAGAEISRAAWAGTLARCGIDGEASLELALATWERDEAASFRLYPDSAPALHALAEAGIRVGLVTNGASSVQRLKLRSVGLADAFDPAVVSSEVGVKKPDPAIFEHALGVAGEQPETTWFVGNHLWHDVAAAAAVGLLGVWIDREGVPREPDWPVPDLTVTSLEQVPALLP